MNLKIKEFFEDNNGRLSSIRLFMLLVCFSAITDWMFTLFTKGVWNPNPEVLMFILGVLGLKVFQKKEEVK